ncbi:hypothetical protein [Bacillus smithii]|uniref:hypothetical protein n=1 Tax=Bacillus smithii TaxID=1479 RepID=UPI0030C8DB2C
MKPSFTELKVPGHETKIITPAQLKVLYMRVSSENQSEEMQLNAAKRYLEHYNPDEVLILFSRFSLKTTKWCQCRNKRR